MERPFIGPLAPQITHVAAAVIAGIAVKQFGIETRLRNPDAVVAVGLGGKVAYRDDELIRFFIPTDEGDDAVTVVVTVDPFKPRFVEILGMQGRFGAVEFVEATDQVLQLLVGFVLQQVPLQIAPDVPLAPLTELHAHKQGFLSGMGEHIAVQTPQVGKFLPLVTGHFPQHIALAVHHFIVGEGEHIVFAVVVPHTEGDVVLVELAEPGVHAEIVEHIVHPAHIPLQVEAETPHVSRPRNHRPGSGFFGNGEDTGEVAENRMVDLAQEVGCFDIFPTPVLVGDPLPFFPAVVEVEHGCHRIHPNAIDVVLIEPEEGVGHQEVANFVTSVVKNQGAPFFVFPFARVGVFVEVRAVKEGQTVTVFGEVTGNPVDNHPNAFLVAEIDKVHQILGLAVAGGGGIVPGDLISPRPVKGVFGDR